MPAPIDHHRATTAEFPLVTDIDMPKVTTSTYSGLTRAQASEVLARNGPNELPRARSRSAFGIILEVLHEPMLVLLLAGGLVYLLLGSMTEAIVLLVFASFSVVITVIQESRTERVLEALRDLAAPRALVIRDGEATRIAGREVVQGDLLVLDAGDRVAADAILVEVDGLEVDESLLTGESLPVRKRIAEPGESFRGMPGGDDLPEVFAASIVTRGRGIARVSATGLRSRVGMIGLTLATLEVEAPRLRYETARIVRICAIGAAIVAVLVVVLYGTLRGDWLDAFLAGIAISMSLLPEEFAVVLTIFLAMGARRIAQVGVLTRRATAIEALGAATVVCTDKTGTLTCNQMAVRDVWLPFPNAPHFAAAPDDTRFQPLLAAAALASAPVPSDPMEAAFHVAAAQAGAQPRRDWRLLHTNGLRPDLLAVSNTWRPPEPDASLTIAAKGAPEAIAQLCRLDEAARAQLDQAAAAMASRGMRVLGVASTTAIDADLGKAHDELTFKLLGLVGLSDPLRADVVGSIAQCRSAGIRVVMITGDYPATARAIAEEAGMATGGVMTGAELASLSDAELASRVGQIDIFARVMPEHKLQIVSALKDAGEVVAMIGDGINDAPALKAADIGIAMGKRGTDVAREAADIVLVDDDFAAIVDAIRVGRRVFDNIRKAMGFIFAVHIPIATLALIPLLIDRPLLLGPIQIALLEMIIDPVCALVFEAEREERGLMHRPPRDPREPLFSRSVVVRGIAQGTLAALVLVGLFVTATGYGLSGDEVRTVTFFALVSATFALVLANRAFGSSLGHSLVRGNVPFRLVVMLALAGSIAILNLPGVRALLGFTALGRVELALVAGIGMALLGLFELTKSKSLQGLR